MVAETRVSRFNFIAEAKLAAPRLGSNPFLQNNRVKYTRNTQLASEVGLIAAGDLSKRAACGGWLGLSVADFRLAPEVGFEPTTNRLTADRSTTELLRTLHRNEAKKQARAMLSRFQRPLQRPL